MKKLKYLLFIFPFFITFNVNALTLNAPSVYYYQNDTPYSSTISTDNWSNTPVYVGTYIGNFGSNTPNITRVDYNWFNLGLCSGKNVSISGSVHAIFGFFLNQSYTLSFYMNNETLTCSTQIFDNGNALHYDCYGSVGGGTFSIYLTENSFTTNQNYHTAVSQDVSYSCDVSNEAIVNQSITNTQDIINNQNQNTQDIINNQNQNTQDIIDSQLSCKNGSEYSFTNDYGLNASGAVISYPGSRVSDFLPIPVSITPINARYTLTRRLCFYKNKSTSSTSFISCIDNQNMTLNEEIDIPTDANYFRFTMSSGGTPNYRICYNSADALSQTLTDESSPPTDTELSSLDDLVSSDTPISDLITMPLTLINSYINGINSSCSSINLGNLYGTNLILPCLNLEQRFGSDLWGKIDILFCIFMCYNIGMLFVTAFDGLTSLRDDFEGLYQPRHAATGYQPKHGGD